MKCLRSTLALRRLYQKEMFIMFVDITKAFDTVNRDLLFQVLLKFGIPVELMDAIKRMYADCKVQVKVGKEARDLWK
jgi:hypothetical protein